MSNAALRSIFAEFGFDIDTAKLDALDKQVKAAADHMRDTAAAAMDFDKVVAGMKGPKTSADAIKAWGAEQKAAADRLKTIDGFLGAKKDNALSMLGDSASRSIPFVRAFGERLNLTSLELGRMVAGATAAATAVIALGAHMAFAFGSQFAASAEALRDTAIESRVTTSELQGLDHAAVQAGVGVERMRSGVAQFGAALRQGERWGNGTTSTLRRLGISARDANGHIRPTADLMDEVAVGLERVENPFRRARVATHLFGEAGRRMLDVLHTGPGGIRALRQELEELGGGVTPEAVEASRKFTQAQERQGRALDSLRSVLATALLPALSWWLNLVARGEGALAKFARGTKLVEVAMGLAGAAGVVAAGAILVAWGPVAAPFVLAALAVAGLVLVIEDLIGFVNGADSATGRMIDSLFGVGSAATAVDFLHSSWAGVKEILDEVEGALNTVTQKFEELKTLAEPVLSRINQVRGYLPGFSSAGGTQVGSAASPAAPTVPDDGGFVAGIERPARGRRGVPVVPGAGAGGAVVGVNVPRMVTVQAPGGGGRSVTRVSQVDRRQSNVFHLAGPDPRQLATQVGEILQRQQREERDANHPTEDDD